MHPNWLGVISFVLTLVVFAWVYRLAKKRPLRWRLVMGGLSAVLALPGASFAFYYTHLLPEMAWYYELRSLPGSELLVVLSGVVGALIAASLPRCVLILPLLGASVIAAVPVLKPIMVPLDTESLREHWNNGVCRQSTASTCGPSSTATILHQFGQRVTEAELAADAHSCGRGTEAWYLARAVRARGFEARFDFGAGFEPERGLPAVVGVRFGVTGHFIAILGREGDRYVVGDPLIGRESLSREQMERRYDFTGFHLRISKPSQR